MRADRLLKLADFLCTVPAKAFDLSVWVKSKPTKPEGKKPGECGFAGCAVGWAAHAQLFPGFEIRRGYLPSYEDHFDWEAVRRVFDLTFKDAEFLFCDFSYDSLNATPKQVAKRIREFVKATSSPPSGGEAVSGSKTSSPGRE